MSWKRGRLFEGGVYKNNRRKSREAFSQGRAFIRSNTVFSVKLSACGEFFFFLNAWIKL